ncbi:MAG: hypothetical protein FWE32_05945 [Oscillospiraceae bacterium]|nr:hypothetical protein [Oscillospiraceae bacterium]
MEKTKEVQAIKNALDAFVVIAAAQVNRNGKLGISVVNTETNGKRLKLTSGLYRELGEPKTLSFMANVETGELALAEELPGADTYPFSQSKSSYIVYAAGMVVGITQAFGLNFEERSSLSFNNVRVERVQAADGREIAVGFVKLTEPK